MENLFASLQNADLFILSSRFEGFPNVLLEAMAYGLPVVSFDCPTGPADIIHNGVDGILVPNENIDELKEAIERVLGNPDLRMRMGLEARGVVDQFSKDRIVGEWLKLLKSAVASRR
jgi:glycosyltransferase involved in cell wall biosynthesis